MVIEYVNMIVKKVLNKDERSKNAIFKRIRNIY